MQYINKVVDSWKTVLFVGGNLCFYSKTHRIVYTQQILISATIN